MCTVHVTINDDCINVEVNLLIDTFFFLQVLPKKDVN